MQALELRINRSTQLSQKPLTPNPRIHLISIEDSTTAKLGYPGGVNTIKRSDVARLLGGLKNAKAKVVVLDMYFDQFILQNDSTFLHDTKVLRKQIANSEPMVVVLGERSLKKIGDPTNPFDWTHEFLGNYALPATPPKNILRGSFDAIERDDVIIGYQPLQKNFNELDSSLPYVALAAYCAFRDIPIESLRIDRTSMDLVCGPDKFPLDSTGVLYIDWTDEGNEFQSTEFSKALTDLKSPSAAKKFENSIIVVGGVEGDIEQTPALGKQPGMVVIANGINALLDGPRKGQVEPSMIVNVLWSLGICLIAVYGITNLRFGLTIAASISSLGVAAFGPQLAFRWFDLWMFTVPTLAAVLMSLFSMGLVTGLTTGRLAERFTPAFARERRRTKQLEVATILFVDLKNSTQAVVKAGAAESSRFLAEILNALAKKVHRNGGEVEHFAGDGLMAVFRERRNRDHVQRCMNCVKSMLTEFEGAGPTENHLGSRPSITMGVETGQISGDIVSTGVTEEWSSFGETIHLAARLQAACKEWSAALLVGPEFYARIGQSRYIEFLGSSTLRGFESRGDIELWGAKEGNFD